MKNKKKVLGLLLIMIILIGAGKFIYDRHINHNFVAITEGKVYKSGVIPPDQLAEYVAKYHIKSIIDLRFPGTLDVKNNPEIPEELIAEKNAVAKIKGVNYFNNGSAQIPTQKNLDIFFRILDDKANYPVLIHCYHGIGRAQLYSALYKIEYENFTNEEARHNITPFLFFSSFADGSPKGEFLKAYKSRKEIAKEKKE